MFNREDAAELCSVTGLRVALRHDLDSVPGAARLPLLEYRALRQLHEAARILGRQSPGAELVLWDAYRSPRSQELLHASAVDSLHQSSAEISHDEAVRRASARFGDPGGVFAHGTGGAVAVTVAVAGRPLDMGCDFGQLDSRARRDHFARHPPADQSAAEAARWRLVLEEAMELAGFVGVESQWWEYEWGTALWGQVRGREPILTEVLVEPAFEGPSRPARIPLSYPQLQRGVAQPFLSAHEARAAQPRQAFVYRYARESHAGADALAELLVREALGGAGGAICASGTAAALHAVEATVPPGGRVIAARDIYQGCKRALMSAGRGGRWKLRVVEDPLAELAAGATCDLVYVDSPSNWLLQCHNIAELADAAHTAGAKLLVDVTLQPCQPALAAGADLVVCSLAKDISLGHTFAGAVACRWTSDIEAVRATIAARGSMIAPETALTVHEHAISLHDRLLAQVEKMEHVAGALKAHPAVSSVKVADVKLCGELPGSQLAFHLADPAQGAALEQLVGQRSLDPSAALHLAGTFGAAFTTIEHFGSRLDLSGSGVRVALTIPGDLVRVGLGCERGSNIAGELGFVLHASAPPRRSLSVSGLPPGMPREAEPRSPAEPLPPTGPASRTPGSTKLAVVPGDPA